MESFLKPARPFEIDFENAKEEQRAAKDSLDLIKRAATRSSGSTANTYVRATISRMVLDVPTRRGRQFGHWGQYI